MGPKVSPRCTETLYNIIFWNFSGELVLNYASNVFDKIVIIRL